MVRIGVIGLLILIAGIYFNVKVFMIVGGLMGAFALFWGSRYEDYGEEEGDE